LSGDEVLQQIDYPGLFELSGQSLPDNRVGVLERLSLEKVIVPTASSLFNVTNLGALLFAKKLSDFRSLSRKAFRVLEYAGQNRVKRIKEQLSDRGYAVGFASLIEYINERLPMNEVIGQALRQNVHMYPELAVRELLANAIVHQDLTVTGDGPMVEIFSDRIEFTNPGDPLIDPLRFLDAPPRSRNEAVAALMRRLRICEEGGSGIDKVVFEIEYYQLPAPDFQNRLNHTKVVLFAHRKLNQMSAKARFGHATSIRALNTCQTGK